MSMRCTVTLVVLGLSSSLLIGGCSGKPSAESVPNEKLSAQQLDAKVQEIQNNANIPPDRKQFAIEEAKRRAGAK